MKFIKSLFLVVLITACAETAPPVEETVTVKGVGLNVTTLRMHPEETVQLNAEVVPADAENRAVVWSVSDRSVASVSEDGLVTSLKEGSAVISVTTDEGLFSVECVLYIKEDLVIEDSGKGMDLDSMSLVMIRVPGKLYLAGNNDSDPSYVESDFFLSECETTYELWDKVYQWAILNSYTFINTGTMGDGTLDDDGVADTVQHPVTTVNWSDAMVWCNALTEMYNSLNEPDLVPVYYTDENLTVVSRVASDADDDVQNPYINDNADGFRLPDHMEWELAARFIRDKNHDGDIVDRYESYKGTFPSGSDSDYSYTSGRHKDWDKDIDVNYIQDVAVYDDGLVSSAAVVKSKISNALHIFDMSGNVSEWTSTVYPDKSHRIMGGAWDMADDKMQLSYGYNASASVESVNLGFRIAQSKISD